jgi:hypothetical protein
MASSQRRPVRPVRTQDPDATAAPPVPVAAARESDSYRYYLRAAVLIGMLAGAALGSVNLTWIAVWDYTGSTPHWVW